MWGGSRLAAGRALPALQKRRDPVLDGPGLVPLGLQIEVAVVVLDGLGRLAGLIVALPSLQVEVLVLPLLLRRGSERVPGLGVELFLLLGLHARGLLRVDGPEEGR